MKPVSLFKDQFFPWRRITNWPHNIRQFFCSCKWAIQRVRRGYCDLDVWDFNCYLISVFSAGCRQLAETTHSFPGRGDAETFEEWQYLLNEAADNAELAYKKYDDFENLGEETAELENFLRFHFWDLWD